MAMIILLIGVGKGLLFCSWTYREMAREVGAL